MPNAAIRFQILPALLAFTTLGGCTSASVEPLRYSLITQPLTLAPAPPAPPAAPAPPAPPADTLSAAPRVTPSPARPSPASPPPETSDRPASPPATEVVVLEEPPLTAAMSPVPNPEEPAAYPAIYEVEETTPRFAMARKVAADVASTLVQPLATPAAAAPLPDSAQPPAVQPSEPESPLPVWLAWVVGIGASVAGLLALMAVRSANRQSIGQQRTLRNLATGA